jgi:hypothetical protein
MRAAKLYLKSYGTLVPLWYKKCRKKGRYLMISVKKKVYLLFTIMPVLFFALILITGCINKEESAWDEAQLANTVISYDKFVANYPKSSFVNDAKFRSNKLNAERLTAFQDLKNAKITIKESYGSAKIYSLSAMITKDISDLLKNAGIQISKDSSKYDFNITVNITGEPLSAFYFPLGTFYTGASLNGNIVFETKDGYSLSQEFFANKQPSQAIYTDNSGFTPQPPKSPDEAPFAELYENYVTEKIVSLTFRALGATPLYNAIFSTDETEKETALAPWEEQAICQTLYKTKDLLAVEPLITALKNEDSYARINAIRALGMAGDIRAIKPLITTLKNKNFVVRMNAARSLDLIMTPNHIIDPRTIKSLITALNDKNVLVHREANTALSNITLQAFGDDENTIKEWQMWWDKQKDSSR